MTVPVLRIEAPSDSQVRYIRSLCSDYGWQHPDAVASKTEASAIIGAMRDGSYRAIDWAWPNASPTHDDADYNYDVDEYGAFTDDSDVPF